MNCSRPNVKTHKGSSIDSLFKPMQEGIGDLLYHSFPYNAISPYNNSTLASTNYTWFYQALHCNKKFVFNFFWCTFGENGQCSLLVAFNNSRDILLSVCPSNISPIFLPLLVRQYAIVVVVTACGKEHEKSCNFHAMSIVKESNNLIWEAIH